MWEFNRGEWTEAYVFLKLLGLGRIYAANEKNERDVSTYLDVLKVLRYENDKHLLEFRRKNDDMTVQAYDNNTLFRVLAYTEMMGKASSLYDAIRNAKPSKEKKGKFPVVPIEDFLKELRLSQPKMVKPPKEVEVKFGKKSDIFLTVEQSLDHAVTDLGFSIKSHLGSSSTLFNCSPASCFKYEIIGCNDAIMDELNGKLIEHPTKMIQYIKKNPNLSLVYSGTSEEFKDNISYVDTKWEDVLACMILIQIKYYPRAKSNKTQDIVAKLVELDPAKARKPETWYKSNFQDFLYKAFCGMTAKEPFDASKKISGGYIDVGKDGEMLYFRAVSEKVFNEYLYEHTYIDRPDRGVNADRAKAIAKAHLEGREPTEIELHDATYEIKEDGKEGKKPVKGDWGYVVKEDNKYYISINFQVRFK